MCNLAGHLLRVAFAAHLAPQEIVSDQDDGRSCAVCTGQQTGLPQPLELLRSDAAARHDGKLYEFSAAGDQAALIRPSASRQSRGVHAGGSMVSNGEA